jgi:hypothetical protein
MNNTQILRYTSIAGMIIFLLSCQQKKDTSENFGKYSLDLLLSEKPANDIYLMPKDSLLTKDSLIIIRMRNLKDTITYNMYLKKQENQIKNWRKKAIDLNLKNRQVEFLRTELDTFETFWTVRKNLTVFFLLDKKEHYFVLKDVDSLKNEWATYGLSEPTNKEEQEKLELENRKRKALESYTPYGIYFTSCNWEYKYSRPEKFTNFFVTLKNTTPNTFKKLKFRVKIYKEEKYGKTEVFSKIIEKNETVYADDVVRFEVFELRDFYVGINITKKENFSWDAELIDAKPRPDYEDLPY